MLKFDGAKFYLPNNNFVCNTNMEQYASNKTSLGERLKIATWFDPEKKNDIWIHVDLLLNGADRYGYLWNIYSLLIASPCTCWKQADIIE